MPGGSEKLGCPLRAASGVRFITVRLTASAAGSVTGAASALAAASAASGAAAAIGKRRGDRRREVRRGARRGSDGSPTPPSRQPRRPPQRQPRVPARVSRAQQEQQQQQQLARPPRLQQTGAPRTRGKKRSIDLQESSGYALYTHITQDTTRRHGGGWKEARVEAVVDPPMGHSSPIGGLCLGRLGFNTAFMKYL